MRAKMNIWGRTALGSVLAGLLMMPPASFGAPSSSEGGGGPKIPIYNPARGQVELVEKVRKSDAQWRKQLTPQQFHITRERGTERAYTGRYHKNKEKGIYHCVACGTALYSSEAKYDSQTGWPSFWQPIAEENVRTDIDKRFFMRRTEVHCARCGAHLGHIFEDGPKPSGKRHCINSEALQFRKLS